MKSGWALGMWAGVLLAGSASLAMALPEPEFQLADPGSEFPVNYTKYGDFKLAGEIDYAYEVRDAEGLAAAVGEGILPSDSLQNDPQYLEFTQRHSPDLDVWSFVDSPSPRDDFYAWHFAKDQDPGARLFYSAEALRRAGLIRHAIKTYYALVVHYPKTHIWTRDGKFYWYAAPEAISRIRRLCAEYPELEVELVDALVDVARAPGLKPDEDRIKVNPGRFVETLLRRVPVEQLKIVEERGGARVKAVRFENGHWQLRVDGEPFTVRGITYSCTRIGETPHAGTLRSWMRMDDNRNGLNDGMFDSWVDANRNNRQDADEPVVGDARLLQSMGVNTIRYYHREDGYGRYNPAEFDKELMRTLYEEYGIRFIVGDFLGAYTLGSAASWNLGTDYRSAEQKARMKAGVRAMVEDHRDEPYVLFWLLGNENQHPWSRTNAGKVPAEYAKFVDEVAAMVKEIDPTRPVAVCNLGSTDVKFLAKYAPHVDIYGANVYAGKYSMGSTTQLVKHFLDRPLFFTEWGCDAYTQGKGLDESSQAEYIRGTGTDMELNMAG
ncbi:MAG: hypothetical protein HQL11_04110, partial [Candidatus Omnitrophica bacterium]|nr:hypothetical protein [Candidatus Omnitrophota bacterium]